MASEGKTKKRSLPAWMTATHKQSKDAKKSKDHDNNCDDNKDPQQGSLDNTKSHEKDGESKTVKSVSELITDGMPFVSVPGRVTYTYQSADCDCICDEILSLLDGPSKFPVGFDMEWPVTFKHGGSGKTALIQMYFPFDKCYLFQVCGMNQLPNQLTRLICHENVLLVGLNIESDLWKLERDFDIRVKRLMDRGSVIDVGKLANKKLKSCERWDLNGLCKNVLGVQLKKDPEIRCGSWNDIPLSQEQIDYSSADAYAGFQLYQQLCDM